jgi:membrane associated rhomboid family serine protease
VIPLKDENPTRHRPIVTMGVVALCAVLYFLWQPTPFGATTDDLAFDLEHAAIPCEVTQLRPLTVDEVRATYQLGRTEACEVGDPTSPAVHPDKSVWVSVLVSMFLHGSILHLAGNLLFLWIFGNNVEDHLGPVRFVVFYVLGGAVATLTHVALNVESTIPMVGASGAIAAVMGAYLAWFPDAPVRTLLTAFFIMVVRIRAKWVLGIWFLLQFLTSPNSGVAWAGWRCGRARRRGPSSGVARPGPSTRSAGIRPVAPGTPGSTADPGWGGQRSASNRSTNDARSGATTSGTGSAPAAMGVTPLNTSANR